VAQVFLLRGIGHCSRVTRTGSSNLTDVAVDKFTPDRLDLLAQVNRSLEHLRRLLGTSVQLLAPGLLDAFLVAVHQFRDYFVYLAITI